MGAVPTSRDAGGLSRWHREGTIFPLPFREGSQRVRSKRTFGAKLYGDEEDQLGGVPDKTGNVWDKGNPAVSQYARAYHLLDVGHVFP